MNRIQFAAVLITALMSIAMTANAATISLVPVTPTQSLPAGAFVTFDVIMDFSTKASGLSSDTTLGGSFSIYFDSAALAFVDLTNEELGNPDYGRSPDILDGILESWSFADFNGLTGPDLVGTVTFIVLAGGPAASLVSTGDTNSLNAGFISAIDFSLLPVEFNAVEVSRIPLPGAGWLMLSSLAAFLGKKNKNKRGQSTFSFIKMYSDPFYSRSPARAVA